MDEDEAVMYSIMPFLFKELQHVSKISRNSSVNSSLIRGILSKVCNFKKTFEYNNRGVWMNFLFFR